MRSSHYTKYIDMFHGAMFHGTLTCHRDPPYYSITINTKLHYHIIAKDYRVPVVCDLCRLCQLCQLCTFAEAKVSRETGYKA